MLKQLHLIDWKSFADATLHVDPLTIVIGKNASGKSNVLDALLFLQRIASGTSISTAISGDAQVSALRGGLEWIVRKPKKEFSLEVLVESDDEERSDYRYNISIAVNGSGAKLVSESLVRLKYPKNKGKINERRFFYAEKESEDSDSPSIATYFYTASKGRGKGLELNRNYSVLSQVDALHVRKEISTAAREVSDRLSDVFILDPIPSNMRNYVPLAEKLQPDAANIAGLLAALPAKRRKIVEDSLSHYLKKFPERDAGRVWTETVGKFGTDAMLYCEEKWSHKRKPTIVDLRGMSDGTLRFLAILTALLTLKENSLLVIEEVDNGLHPSRTQDLVEMLRDLGQKRNIDVVVTTHNPAMLDALGNKMIPFVTVAHRDNSGDSCLSLLEDIEQLPKMLAQGRLGWLSTQGKVETALPAHGQALK